MMSYFVFAVIICVIVQVFVALLVLTLIILLKAYLPDNDPVMDEKLINLNDFKTGDIISVAYANVNTNALRLLTDSVWNHNGIIYIDPETKIIYVLEGSVYRGSYRGFMKIPLTVWIRINRKCRISVRHIKEAVDADRLIKTFKKFSDNAKLGGAGGMRVFRFIRKDKYKEDFDYQQSFTCYEGTFRVLQEMDVFKKDFEGSYYRPADMLFKKDFLEDPESYSKPYELKTGIKYGLSYIP